MAKNFAEIMTENGGFVMCETDGRTRNLVMSDGGELCAITPGPNLVPATPEEERRYRGGETEKSLPNEEGIPV
ncbi:MAG: hypothetical protein ACD_11C00029G0045 [uncultured bacterium]|nr:MAG: hypothetical protein ACD_11C00029G0045 [uncultured bacterium]HBR72079.1 hypothetical protein [Candidatus Moranbacteria bacterium]